ncbi:RNA polymerase sigma factor [Shimazuella kribbensis]|uniref:RNA polymerase sigma factor n=1 Tax=Shimazuella kribbensis TaxID=139808 RepID=UPI00041457FA|nr:sigma-70 family RNA polymerase sigma factor [Shimazuella kribbensis]
MTEQDARWVEQVRAGQLDAYDQLVQKYMNKVYYLLYRMIGREEDAKDLAQECFIRAYKHLHQYDITRSFSSWLYKIAINLCRNELQKQKRQAFELQGQLEIADTENPEQVYIQKEETRRYQQEIDLLPPFYREVLILRYYQELSYVEISESLGITETDVRNYLYRAKRKLRKQTSFIRLKKEVSL